MHYFARVNLSFADVTCLSHEENKLHQPTEQPEGPFFTKGRYLNFFYAVRNLHNTNLKPTYFVCWLQRKLKLILKNNNLKQKIETKVDIVSIIIITIFIIIYNSYIIICSVPSINA